MKQYKYDVAISFAEEDTLIVLVLIQIYQYTIIVLWPCEVIRSFCLSKTKMLRTTIMCWAPDTSRNTTPVINRMENKSCKLTALGQHYWKLVREGKL
jgi:hypothetical protein